MFDKDLIHDFFHLGLMGIEIPEQYGGGGAKFFEAILAVEELSRVDASSGVIVDVQNTLVNNALLRWGSDAQKKHYLPKMADRDPRRLRSQRGRFRLRRFRLADSRPIERQRVRAQWPQALDHKQQRGRLIRSLRHD